MSIKEQWFQRERFTEYLIYLLTPSFFLGKTYKVIAFFIVCSFVFDMVKNKRWDFLKDSIFMLLSAWCGYLLLSSLWATHSVEAITGSLELYIWVLLYLAIRFTLVSTDKIEFFIKLQAFMVLFLFVNGIMQFFIGFNMFGIPLDSGQISDLVDGRRTTAHLLPIWIGLFGAMLATKLRNKQYYVLMAVALAALLITIPLMGKRGPLVIMAVFLPLIAWMSPFRKQAFVGLAGLLIVIFWFVATSPSLQQRFETLLHPFENQKHYRVAIWKTAFEEFKANPIGGVGFHNFRYRTFEYYKDSFESYEIVPKDGKNMNHAHSPWADILAEQGLIGAFFGISLLFLIGRISYQMGPVVFIGGVGVWFSFSVLNSGYSLSSDKWSFFMILAVSFFAMIVNHHRMCEDKIRGNIR